MAEDLKRLEAANPKAFDDRILKEFPYSDAAYSVVRERWRKAHQSLKIRATLRRGRLTIRLIAKP